MFAPPSHGRFHFHSWHLAHIRFPASSSRVVVLQRRCCCGLYQTPILNPESCASSLLSLSLSLSQRARNCNGKGTPFPRRPCFLVYLNENEYDSVPLAPCAEALKEHCGGNLLPKIYLEYCRTFHINQRQEFNYLSVGRPNANKPYSIVKPQLAFDSALRQVHIDRSAPLGID